MVTVALIWGRLLSQQRALSTAVRIVAVHTLYLSFCRWLVLLQLRGLLVAGKTDFFFGHGQNQRGHVAFGRGQMADGARNRHGGMHGLALGLIGMTGGTIGILGENARVLDGVFDGGC